MASSITRLHLLVFVGSLVPISGLAATVSTWTELTAPLGNTNVNRISLASGTYTPGPSGAMDWENALTFTARERASASNSACP